ncbi:hypothetical protein F2P56_028229 [Juglans regia]|uniref:Phosphatidylinositol-glycan biosynthesis class F protein-like isoform X1 n=2 Tax=Juglans regia TaxID=51240 RepID=A0A2I4GUE0_JUGRE|nr:phosphatidylinositol-glycan biosynthesis class F protein-like isoform X1 [Juglans regia]KAF5453317.1 hypothetical protein F2P56_028229 [Juglans regia]
MKANATSSFVKSSAEPELEEEVSVSSTSISALEALSVHLISVLGLVLALLLAHTFFSVNLVSHPSPTLLLVSIIECPIVILLYSRYRKNRDECTYLKAVGQGLLGLPVGALVNALGAIALGAPVGTQYFLKTINWSLMMSLFTIVPAVSVFGSSWKDWQRIFANTKPIGSLGFIIYLPAHGAIIGAWLGALPMPLDWERSWQEWPICVSYGAMAGYLVAMVASSSLILARARFQHVKVNRD